jgi:amino acid transporter
MATCTDPLGKGDLRPPGKLLGTFEGVFVPNILTILGVIMYLRQGKVMGEAGLVYGLLIIGLAHLVTITTGLSLSAIATNMRVKAGGAYYMTSRSLGLEWGGCIGVPLAIAQTLSIALYTLGFAESFKMLGLLESLTPYQESFQRPVWEIASVALALMAFISLLGSSLVIRTQLIILALVVGSLISIFAGWRIPANPPHLFGQFQNLDFWQTFAIYFPAVTGIMSGVSLSGDLKDPGKSIPRGTMAAVLVGMGIYAALGIFLCIVADPGSLTGDNAILLKIAKYPGLVVAGVFAATLSSGLGMILAAPRTIQALARDGVLPGFLGATSGRTGEPVVALILSLVIAEAAILMGRIDIVAPILSMFFLATYGILNLISGMERLIGNPSYRPTLNTPWWISLIGALCSFYVMFLINTPATLISMTIIGVIYIILRRRQLTATWGDLWRGFWLSLVRRALLQLEQLPDHPRNWRPIIMVVTGVPQGRSNLVHMADWLGSGKGLVNLRHVIVGPIEKMGQRRKIAQNNLARFIKENNLIALSNVDVLRDRVNDIRTILRSQGFGSFVANTVILDWNEREELKPGEFEKLCQGVMFADKTLLILRVDPDRHFRERRKISVWMEMGAANRAMTLILGYLISQDPDWAHSSIQTNVTLKAHARESDRLETEALLAESRIPMQVQFHEDIMGNDIFSHADEVSRRSIDSDILIVPLSLDPAKPEDLRVSMDRIQGVIGKLPSVLMVRADATIEITES